MGWEKTKPPVAALARAVLRDRRHPGGFVAFTRSGYRPAVIRAYGEAMSIFSKASEADALGNDPKRGWHQEVAGGETTGRSTFTRAAVGTMLLPGVGTAVGVMAKKRRGYVYIQTFTAAGIMVKSERRRQKDMPLVQRAMTTFNRRHLVGEDGRTEVERAWSKRNEKRLAREVKKATKQAARDAKRAG